MRPTFQPPLWALWGCAVFSAATALFAGLVPAIAWPWLAAKLLAVAVALGAGALLIFATHWAIRGVDALRVLCTGEPPIDDLPPGAPRATLRPEQRKAPLWWRGQSVGHAIERWWLVDPMKRDALVSMIALRGEDAMAVGAALSVLGASPDDGVDERAPRSEQTIPPDSQHEARLLVAVTYDGATATILAHTNNASAEVESVETVFVSDLDVKGIPRDVGLHVWEGEVYQTDASINDVGALVEPAYAEWCGTWRRATPEEAQRCAAGEPVWGSR